MNIQPNKFKTSKHFLEKPPIPSNSFNLLPPELYNLIFSFSAYKKNDFFTHRLVSKKWKRYIDNHESLINSVFCCPISKYFKSISYFIKFISRYKDSVTKLEFCELDPKEAELQTICTTNLPPTYLKFLHSSYFNYDNTFQCLTNLKILKLPYTTYSRLATISQYTQLQTFKLNSKNYLHVPTSTLVNLFKNNLHLENLTLMRVFFPENETLILNSLSERIKLTKLELKYCKIQDTFLLKETIKNLTRLKSLSISNHDMKDNCLRASSCPKSKF